MAVNENFKAEKDYLYLTKPCFQVKINTHFRPKFVIFIFSFIISFLNIYLKILASRYKNNNIPVLYIR